MKVRIAQDWRTLKIQGVSNIQKLIGVYEVTIQNLTRSIEIKVFERSNGFVAFSSLAIKDKDGIISGTCGLGDSEMEALQDCLMSLMGDLASLPKISNELVIYRDEQFVIDVTKGVP